ncbi:unnamed protein product [Rhizophagus irregularis]|nr:unnamed protein product [Rhizophagus irregularis]
METCKNCKVIEWCKSCYDEYNGYSRPISKGGFGEIYKAKWKGAYVVLKKLYDSQNITVDFLNEVKNYILTMESNRKTYNTSFLTRFYGISYNSITQNFIIVTEYADGDFKKNIMEPVEFTNRRFAGGYSFEYSEFSANKKIIFGIAQGLNKILPICKSQ